MSVFSVALTAMLFSFVAHKAVSADLTVRGTIRPTACIPALSNAGIVDYQTIDATKIPANRPTVLDVQSISFSVNCNGPAVVALRLVDNRAASVVPGLSSQLEPPVPGIQAYGLGTASGTNIGIYTVKVEPGSITGLTGDGTAVGNLNIFGSLGANDSWTIFSSSYFNADGVSNWKGFGMSVTAPDPFVQLAGKFSVTAILDKGANLPLRENINLDGSATLELMYL